MANEMIECRRSPADPLIGNPEWSILSDNTYECRVLLCPSTEGGYSAYALRLPGVVSEGDTTEEAIANICDAFQAALQVYLENDGQIPWQDVEVERTKDCEERWVLVNV